MLVRLLYTSRATAGIDDAMMRSILERSELHNAEHGITGILCTAPERGIFLQVRLDDRFLRSLSRVIREFHQEGIQSLDDIDGKCPDQSTDWIPQVLGGPTQSL